MRRSLRMRGSIRKATAKNPKASDDALGFLEQVTGIEPAYSAWEADTLPLSYTCGMRSSQSSSIIIQNASIVKTRKAFYKRFFLDFLIKFAFFGTKITKIRGCNSPKTY